MAETSVVAIMATGMLSPIRATPEKCAEITNTLASEGPIVISPNQEGGQDIGPIIGTISLADGYTLRSSKDEKTGVVFLVYGEEALVDEFTKKKL